MGAEYMLLFQGAKKEPGYYQRILNNTPLAYWPLNEQAGTTIYDRSGNAYNGTAGGAVSYGLPGIGDGLTSIYSATVCGVNVGGAPFRSAFNGNLLTLSGWAKVNDSTIWTDSTNNYICNFLVDANNQIYIRSTTTSNLIHFVRIGSTTTKSITYAWTSVVWFHVAIVVNQASDWMKFYVDGAQICPTQTTIGSFAGTLAAGNTVLGAISSGLSSPWKGYLQHWMVKSAALDESQVAQLARCNGFVVFDGDSRTTGGAVSYPVGTMTTLRATKRYGMANSGVSGNTIAQMTTSIVSELAAFKRIGNDIVVLWGGVNDAHAGANAATIYARMQTYCALIKAAGYKVVLCSEIDDQSAEGNAVGWHSTVWPALNTLINADNSFADGYANLGGNANLQDATNATYFNVDQIHLTDAGYAVVAGIVATAVGGL